MKQFTYVVTDPFGIHARPAGLLAKTARAFPDASVIISKDGADAHARQLMKLMSLGVKQGDRITVSIDGPSEEAASAAMLKCLSDNL